MSLATFYPCYAKNMQTPRDRGWYMTIFRATVNGNPVTQGSSKAFPFRRANGKLGVTVTSASPKLKPWRTAMHDVFVCALQDYDAGAGYADHCIPLYDEAVCVITEFILPRLAAHPKTSKGTEPGPPTGKRDLDKLVRAVHDSLTTAGVLADDGLVCEIHTSKRFAAIGEAPGVVVEVTAL